MKRKNFISAILLAISTLSFAEKLSSRNKKSTAASPGKKGFVVRSDESRYNGKLIQSENGLLRCKISSTDTNEDLFIQTSTPKVFEHKGGPPPHIHQYEDEIIYIVSGEFIVHINGEDINVQTGDTAFIPRGTLHTIINPVENNPGTLITIFQPAPKKIEDFFNHISQYGEIPKDIVPDGW